MLDADGSFYLNWKLNEKDLPIGLVYYLRISQKQTYNRKLDLSVNISRYFININLIPLEICESYLMSGFFVNNLNSPYLMKKRFFSVNSKDYTAVLEYSDSWNNKSIILKENKAKSGVYCWTNKLDGKRYIGSSVNLSQRLYGYYDLNYLSIQLKKANSYIYRALIKYGYSNFKLEILEYCDKNACVKRVSSPARRLKRGDYLLEQSYLLLLKPDYNILKTAGSRLGLKHTKETRDFISALHKGREVSGITRAKLAAYRRGLVDSEQVRIKKSTSSPLNIKIEVTDVETNTTTVYHSLREAARNLNTRHSNLNYYIKVGKLFQNRYKIVKI